jgi:Transglycosylase SLT domain
VSDTPIIKIEIDQSEWDDFQAKWSAYKDDLEKQPSAWEGVNHGVGGLKDNFEKVLGDFENIAALSTSSKLSGQSSFISGFAKSSTASEKSWGKISKDIATSHRNLTGIAQMGIKLGAFGTGLLGAAAGGAAALYGGVVASAADLAGQNASNRQLGLAPGEEKAFENDYQKMGGSRDLLARIAQAKTDPRMWTGLITAGVPIQDIQSKSPTEIAAEFLEGAGKRMKDAGPVGAAIASANRMTDFADVLTLQQASTYGHEDYQKTHNDFQADVPRLALQQQKLDEATAAKAKFDTAADEAKTAIEGALVQLAPELTRLTLEFADVVKAFSQSGDLQRDIDGAIGAFEKVEAAGDWVAGKLNKLFGGDDSKDTKPRADVTLKGGSFAAKATTWANDTLDALNGHPHAPSDSSHDLHYQWLWDKQSTTAADKPNGLSELDKANGLPPGLLNNVERQESSNGRNVGSNTNDSAGPAGPFQLTKATADRLGVKDRMSEQEAGAGASKYLAQLIRRYSGDTAAGLAAYDGFVGLDADIARYGNKWQDHLSEFGPPKAVAETQKYLRDMQANGTDLRYTGDDNQQFIAQELAKRMKSLRAAPSSTATQSGGPVFHMPTKSNYLTLPITNIHVTVPAGSSVHTSLGGLT